MEILAKYELCRRKVYTLLFQSELSRKEEKSLNGVVCVCFFPSTRIYSILKMDEAYPLDIFVMTYQPRSQAVLFSLVISTKCPVSVDEVYMYPP